MDDYVVCCFRGRFGQMFIAMISVFHRNLSSRRVVIIGVMIALVVVVFIVPVVPTTSDSFLLAGFFPRYESVSCVLIHVGMAYGPNSFDGMKWVLGACHSFV